MFAGSMGSRFRFMLPLLFVLLICGIGAGLRDVRRLNGPERAHLLLMAGAMLCAALTTAFTAYLHFGLLCCERHETVRRMLTLLAASALAIVVFGGKPLLAKDQSRALQRACLLLLAATLPAAALWGTRILPVYSREASTEAAWRTTFEYAPGDGSMVYQLTPADPVLGNINMRPGTYTAQTSAQVEPLSILRYFHKQRLVVRPSPPE
jgi:hypothetical protein